MKIAIVSDRNKISYRKLRKVFLDIYEPSKLDAIYSGDRFYIYENVEMLCKKEDIKYIHIPSENIKFKDSDAYDMNQFNINLELCKLVDNFIIFWDGKDKSIEHLINIAGNQGKYLTIIKNDKRFKTKW